MGRVCAQLELLIDTFSARNRVCHCQRMLGFYAMNNEDSRRALASVVKIVSGGQTDVDRAALDWAI